MRKVTTRPTSGRTPSAPSSGDRDQPRRQQVTVGMTRIVVGVDDSPGGFAALRWAISEARSSGIELVAVRSWALGLPRHGGRRRSRLTRPHPHIVLDFDGFEQGRRCEELVRRSLRIAAGGPLTDLRVTVQTPEGEPGAVLTNVAQPGDLLVVGRDTEPSLKRLLHGSVSSYCRENARCPVFVVSADDLSADDLSADYLSADDLGADERRALGAAG